MAKVLTVRNPWAWAIINGGKNVENRGRRTNYRGQLYIHAGLGWSYHGLDTLRNRGLAVEEAYATAGMVLGTVNVIDCHNADTCEAASGEYCSEWALPGYWHWVLADPKALDRPVSVSGRLGIWNLPIGEAR